MTFVALVGESWRLKIHITIQVVTAIWGLSIACCHLSCRRQAVAGRGAEINFLSLPQVSNYRSLGAGAMI
jgi:hypothetical protein